MIYLNNVKIVPCLPSQIEFKKIKKPICYEGKYYQLCVGEKRTPLAKRITSFVKAFFGTVLTGFIGLSFPSIRKQWSRAFYSTHTVKRYVEVPSFPRNENKLKVIAPPLIRQLQAAPIVNNEMLELEISDREKKCKEDSVHLRQGASFDSIQPEAKVQKEINVEEVLETIQKAAQTDLYLDDQYIEKKFGISSLFASLNEEEQLVYREKLNHIINTAYLQRMMRDKSKIVMGEYLEDKLLIYLSDIKGLKSAYYDKEAIYAAFKEITEIEIQPKHFKESPAAFRHLLKECALKSRLQMVNIKNEDQIAKFKWTLALMQEMEKELDPMIENTLMSFLASSSLPLSSLGAQLIRKKLNSRKAQIKNIVLKKIFSYGKIKEKFLNENIKTSSFEIQTQEWILSRRENIKKLVIINCENKTIKDERISELINLYTQWGSDLKAEMIQGFSDTNEALSQGVCFAVCFRLLEQFQLNPDQEIEVGQILSVNPIDRFRQALYNIKAHIHYKYLQMLEKEGKEILDTDLEDLEDCVTTIPNEWLDKSNFEEGEQLLEVIYDPDEPDFRKIILSPIFMKKLENSHGWVSLGLTMHSVGGHQVLMRLDQNRQKAWFFDPNIGLFCFEAKEKTFEQAKDDCLKCFKDICDIFYPSLYNISAVQLIPKQTQ